MSELAGLGQAIAPSTVWKILWRVLPLIRRARDHLPATPERTWTRSTRCAVIDAPFGGSSPPPLPRSELITLDRPQLLVVGQDFPATRRPSAVPSIAGTVDRMREQNDLSTNEIRRWRKAVGLLGILLLAGGCGGDSHEIESALAVSKANADALRIDPQTGNVPGPERPVPVIRVPHRGRYVVMPWQFAGLNDGGARLRIVYLPAGGCMAPAGIVVRETASSVLLAPLAKNGTGKICSSAAHGPLRGIVRLERPLGSRRLLHARTSPRLTAELTDLEKRPPTPAARARRRIPSAAPTR